MKQSDLGKSLDPNVQYSMFYFLRYWYTIPILRPNFWTKSRQNSSEFSSLLYMYSHLYTLPTALPWDFYFFKLTQPLTYFFKRQTFYVFYVQFSYCTCTVKEKGGKPDRKSYHLPIGLRNPYRNLKSQNLKIMPRNLNEVVCSWILLIKALVSTCTLRLRLEVLCKFPCNYA
jgi:hypothetical protein